jgi:hypothetical protein
MPDVVIPDAPRGEAARSDVIVSIEERQHRQTGDTA